MISRGRALSVLAAAVALACTYDFDRFEDANPASSGASSTAGSSGAGAANTGGRATSGAGGQAGENEPSGTAGAPSTGEGGGGFSCAKLDGVVHEGHCYFAIAPGTGLSWSAAREACESYSTSSHLLTIGSNAEQRAVEDALTPAVSDFWIGLSLANVEDDPGEECEDAPESCPFTWVDGEAVSYANWAEHSKRDVEPNYTGACVRLQLDGFKWADFDCSTRLPAVCEHDG